MNNSKIDIHKVFADYFDRNNQSDVYKIAYACSKKLSEGHICLDLKAFNKEHETSIQPDDLLESRWFTSEDNENQVFILKNNKVYLHRYFSYESEILQSIQQLTQSEDIQQKDQLLVEHKAFIQSVFKSEPNEINWQLVAALMAFRHQFSIITGGPGTGKTTTIAQFLAMVYKINPKAKVALAAPTGKAAVRIKESILHAKSQIEALDEKSKSLFDQINSSTIHRLLGYKKGTHYFKHNAQNPLNYDIIIVDESSMIGISLMAKLMQAIPSDKQIILLGDKDQLASVEAGSVFGDICQSQSSSNAFNSETTQFINQFSEFKLENNPNAQDIPLSSHIVELQKSFRFDKNKGIGQISYSVLEGKLKSEDIETFKANDQVRMYTDYRHQDFRAFHELYETYISEKDTLYALKAFSQVRLLSPTHLGEHSVDFFNREIENHLKSKSFLFPKLGFYHNQPIMITQNDYHLNLFNGDVGLVREDKNGELQAYFEAEDGSLRTVSPNFINNYKTVFAMTIHKSQGSEFDHVAIVLPEQEDLKILSKELIYTGLTRAKKDLWIFSKASILEKASQRPVQRASGITERIMELN